jgi:hypothetical protein
MAIASLMPGATETNFFHRAGMDNTKVGMSQKDDPADVAKSGFEALVAGEDHLVAGSFKNKVQARWPAFCRIRLPQKCIVSRRGKIRRSVRRSAHYTLGLI